MTTLTRIGLSFALAAALVPAAPAAAQHADKDRKDKDWTEPLKESVLLAAEAGIRAATEALEQIGPQIRAQRGRADRDRGPELVENQSRTVRIGRTGLLDLSNIAGDIEVQGGGGDEARITWVKRVRNRDAGAARDTLRDLDVQISERSNAVEIRAEFPRGRQNVSASIDFGITVPSGTSVTLKTISGDIRLSNIKGDLRAETTSGDITATSVGRVRYLHTLSGDIEVASSTEADDLTVGTASGDITIRAVRARTIEIESISGDARLIDVETDRTTIKAISGDIEYAGRLSKSGRYEFQTHSGDIRVRPSGQAAFDLEASTFNGDIRSDYPLKLRDGQLTQNPGGSFSFNGARGPRFNRTVRGTTEGGGALLSLTTFNGDIAIAQR